MAYDQQATYAINLEDNTSGAAESAASALGNLKKSIASDTAALAGLQKAMKNLQGGSVVNIALAKELKAKIDAKKNSIAAAQASYIQLGGSLSNMGRKSKPTIDAFDALKKNAAAMPGPLGGVVSSLGSLKGLVAGGAIAGGVLAIVAGLVALTAAAIAAAAALLKYGVAQANARRSELLRIEGLTKMRNWYGLAAGNAAEMQNTIDRVAAGSATGRDKLAEYSSELYRMGLRGENLNQTLEAMAIKQSTQGDAAAHAFAGWAAGAALAGGSVKKLADDVKARLGGIAAKQMLDLDVQAQKMRESFSALFATLKIEALVKAFGTISQLFSQNTKSGQALKAIVRVIFQPMIDAITFLAPYAKRFFQGMIIGGLLVAIAFLTVRNAFRRAFGEVSIFKNIDTMTIALKLGAVAVGALAVALGLVAAIFGAFLVNFAIAGAFIYGLIRAAKAVVSYFGSIDWSKLGKSLTDGIINGVKNGAHKVIAAVKDLGAQAWEAFRSKLGIASPSKVFTQLGLALPQGVERGIKSGTPGARRAASDIVPVPRINVSADVDGNGKARGLRGAGKAPINVTFGDININGDTEKPAELVADIKRELQTMLEQVLLQLGGTVEPA